MTRDDTLSGVESRIVSTDRLETHVLEAGNPDGHPVIFLHGTVSSSRFWEDTLAALEDGFRAVAPDFRGYGDSEPKPVDATNGIEDFERDLEALISTLELDEPATLVGWSLGGGVAVKRAIAVPETIAALILVNPISPYGFTGTKDLEGTACWPDWAGSGAGIANWEFVAGLRNRVRDGGDGAAPRTVLRSFYVADGFEFDADREESYLTGMLDTAAGENHYPGTSVESDHWPGVAPGDRGVNNAISPKHCDLTGIVEADPAPPCYWLRGGQDVVISNESLFDLGTLGRLGELEGWPDEETFPPQPMVDQTRAILESYADRGGEFEEVVFESAGHTPHVEAPTEFRGRLEGILSSEHRRG